MWYLEGNYLLQCVRLREVWKMMLACYVKKHLPCLRSAEATLEVASVNQLDFHPKIPPSTSDARCEEGSGALGYVAEP